MAVVSATSRHFQRNDMMIADVSHEIEWVTMQLLSLKTKSGKREAGFMESFDKDNLTLHHGDEESYMHLEESQWPH